MTETFEALETASPPHDLVAEQAVLGAMMLNPAVADEITERLSAEDFYRPIHQTIFRVILDVATAGERPDAVAVAAELAKREELGRVGGAPYLGTLINGPFTPMQGGYYAGLVYETAARRRLLEAVPALTTLARSPALLSEVRERAVQAVIDATTDERERTELEPVGDLVGPVLEHVQAIADGDIPAGIPTGLREVDRVTGGMHPGQLIIPAARTGVGKSVITQNWILHGVRTTMRPGILFSNELPKNEMIQRLLAELAQVSLTQIRKGQINESEWARLVDAERQLRELPLYVTDSCRTTPAIRSYARRLRQREGDLALIGVDYLQRVRIPDAHRMERHESVGMVADQLKDLALDMEIPVISPCQLNRGPENRVGKAANKPRLSDLRESGNIEQTADVVALLFRDDYYDKKSTRRGEADIDIAKNRNGPTDLVVVGTQLQFQKFIDLPTFGTPEPRDWE